jgi:hypothetical protein
MQQLDISLRLRPIRFGFLVDPNDQKSLLEIFQINTCLWGGQYNPIIPYYKRLPKKWWNRIHHPKTNSTNARSIVDQYIAFFEPDFLVIPKGMTDENFDFDPRRIITLQNMLSKSNEQNMEGYGLQTDLIYEHLFKNKFQFVYKNKPSIIYAKGKTNSDDLLLASLLGSFPKQADSKHFQSAYESVFSPEIIQMDSQLLEKIYNRNFSTPLDIGSYGIDVIHHDHYCPRIFMMDGKSGLDLIDFWNFRSIYRDIIPFPYKHLRDPINFIKQVFTDLQGQLPGSRSGLRICPTLMLSRSISISESEDFYSQIITQKNQHRSIQPWFPEFWINANTPYGQYSRATLRAAEKTYSVDVNTSSPKVKFKSLRPPFEDPSFVRFAVANVVKINHRLSETNIATVYPVNCKDSSFLKLGPIVDPLISTTEGLIVFSSCFGETKFWTLSNGTVVLQAWFDRHNIKTSPSSAGRSPEQILRMLPGAAINSIRFKGVIKKLDKMASCLIRSDNLESFNSSIKKATKHGKSGICYHLRNLIQYGAVKLGLHVKCSYCDYWNWFALNELDENLECDRCRRAYSFPIHNPADNKSSKWAYRVLGPFSLPDYAQGGYSAALSISFFRDILASYFDNVLWSHGIDFTFPDDEKCEADFILLFQQSKHFGSYTTPIMLFGEAKSFGHNRIENKEITRLKKFARKFPGSGIVISMLRTAKEMNNKEIKLLRDFALWGKQYNAKKSQIRAPVIILTADELFAQEGTPSLKILEGIRPYGPSRIHALATYTQKKYLNIAP